jgi:hypothetical protein
MWIARVRSLLLAEQVATSALNAIGEARDRHHGMRGRLTTTLG